MQLTSIIEGVNAPKSKRTQITVTVNDRLLKKLDRLASESDRNRSEMIDRVIEAYPDSTLTEQSAKSRK